MSINQLTDDGAVIGYRPTLQYVNIENLKNAEDVKSSSATNYSGEISYSKTVNNFSNNLPSSSLKNIDNSLDNIKHLIDRLALSFKNGDWNQYDNISLLLNAIENDNQEYATNFIEYHKNNITGSIIPELICIMHNASKRLEILSNTLKELYYGKSSLTTDEIKEIDKSILDKIKSYEASKDISKINYLALSYDSVLSRSVSMHTYGINEQTINIADIVISSDSTNADASKKSLIQKLFNETNKDIDYRQTTYDKQQNVEIMQKTLYNYYNKRQEMIELYDLLNANNGSIFIGRKIQDYQQQLNEAVINVNRSFVGSQHFLSEITKLEREKYFLKNIYASFNYNSGI